jgi:hypothetical protein
MTERPEGDPVGDADERWAGDEGTPLGHQGTRAGEGMPVPSGSARAFGVVAPDDTSELDEAREEEAEMWRRRNERRQDLAATGLSDQVLEQDGREILAADVDVLASIAEADARSRSLRGLAWALGIYFVTSCIAFAAIWRAAGASSAQLAVYISGFGGIASMQSPTFASLYIVASLLVGMSAGAAAFAGTMFAKDWRWGLYPVLVLAALQAVAFVPLLLLAQPEPVTPGALAMGALFPVGLAVFGALFGAGVGDMVVDRA